VGERIGITLNKLSGISGSRCQAKRGTGYGSRFSH
jgi:hypothetical protein